MRVRQTRQRGWVAAFSLVFAVVVAAGCGRVDLEDLTPEAFKTQQAAQEATRIAGGPVATPVLTGTQGTGGIGGFEGADLVAGQVQYNTWCAACHDSARAPALKGRVFAFEDIENTMRTGQGFAQQHPSYTVFELTNQQLVNILAYVAGEPAP